VLYQHQFRSFHGLQVGITVGNWEVHKNWPVGLKSWGHIHKGMML